MQVSENSKMVSKSRYNQTDLDNSFFSKNDMSMSNNRISIRGGVAQSNNSGINKTVIRGGGGKNQF